MKISNTLYTPGPVIVRKEVLEAASQQVIFHRTQPFEKLYLECKSKLLKIFDADDSFDCLIINGPGTLSNEVIISSLSKNDRILLLNNGEFGERLLKIIKLYKLSYKEYRESWGISFSIKKVEELVKSYKPTILVMVGMETSTGMNNPYEVINKICLKKQILLFVDAVSALGTELLSVKKQNIDICVSVPNKGIESIPGLSFICIKKELLNRLVHSNKKSLCLDIERIYEYSKKNQTPFTPSINVFFALNKALDLFLAEGAENRIKRYKECARLIDKYVKRLNLKYFIVNKRYRSNAVISILFPNSISVNDLHQYLLKKKLTIWYRQNTNYPKLDYMAQISVMGNINEHNIAKLFKEITSFLKR